ncbi:unnamed protein product [Arabidopsis halleri]
MIFTGSSLVVSVVTDTALLALLMLFHLCLDLSVSFFLRSVGCVYCGNVSFVFFSPATCLTYCDTKFSIQFYKF